MKKITRILRTLEKTAKEMIKLQKEYNKHKYTKVSNVTGREIECYDTSYFPAKMEKFYTAGHGYFTPWHWFSERFYDEFNRLNDEEQYYFVSNIHKYTCLFAAVKAGYMYNFPRIYEEWGYDPIMEEDYYHLGVFDEDEYAKDMEEDKERYLYYANVKLKKNIGLLAETIHDGEWGCACPGHHKVLRMKHNPW